MIFGLEALEKLCTEYKPKRILDIGSGMGLHAKIMRETTEAEVITLDFENADIIADYNDEHFSLIAYKPFDCIWCCHVLEHQLNVNHFLKKIRYDLTEGGVLAITVPPAKHQIVGGHVTLWNAGLLLYNLVLAGFDCSEARIKQYGYNISVIIKKKPIALPKLNYDHGDIAKLAKFFPEPYRHEGFNGDIKKWNWDASETK